MDVGGRGARVEIEDRFPRAVVQTLAARGHRFQKIGRKGELRYGFASGALIDEEHGQVEGGADPRRSHAAVALESGSSSSQQQ
jgi:gamma-glutamyltranspeptidase